MSNIVFPQIQILGPDSYLKIDEEGNQPNPINLISNPLSLEFMSGLNEIGSFRFSMRFNDKKAFGSPFPNGIEIGNIVKIFLDTTNSVNDDGCFLGIIEDIQFSNISSDNLDPVLTVSGRGIGAVYEDMLCLNIPGSSITYTGTTPGNLFKTLFLLAKARGCYDKLPLNFTNENDTKEVPWNLIPFIEVQHGTTLSDLLRQLNDLGFSSTITNGLNLFNNVGLDKTNEVIINQGITQVDAHRAGPLKNTAYVKVGMVAIEEINTSSRDTYGRKETYLDGQGYSSSVISNLVFNKLAYPNELNTLSYIYSGQKGCLPYKDYNIGDTITVITPMWREGNKLSLKVIGITVSIDSNGVLTVTPEFGNRKEEFENKLQRLFNKLNSGTADGVASDLVNTLSENMATGVETTDLTVQTYDNLTATGTGEDPFANIQGFLNGTDGPLNVDDVITTIDDGTGNLIAIAVKSRAGAIVPTNHPNAVLAGGYPFNSGPDDSLFPYSLSPNGSQQIIYDNDGVFGYGLDTLISKNWNGENITYYSKQTDVNGILCPNPISGYTINSIHAIGDWIFLAYNDQIQYKQKDATTWNTMAISGSSSYRPIRVAEDKTTNTIYVGWTEETTNYLRVGYCDTTGYHAISTSTNYTIDGGIDLFTAGHGKILIGDQGLLGYPITHTRYYVGNTSNVNMEVTFAGFVNGASHIDSNYLYAFYESAGHLCIEKINYYTGSRSAIVTPILSSDFGNFGGGVTVGGITYFTFRTIGSNINGTLDPGTFYYVIGSFNGLSLSIFYYNADYTGSLLRITSPQYVGTKIRTSATFSTPGSNSIHYSVGII